MGAQGCFGNPGLVFDNLRVSCAELTGSLCRLYGHITRCEMRTGLWYLQSRSLQCPRVLSLVQVPTRDINEYCCITAACCTFSSTPSSNHQDWLLNTHMHA